MNRLSGTVKFLQVQNGASIVEYALLIGLIAIVCIAGMGLLGTRISGVASALSSNI
jgi:Flp pilus assembly pilin Flp